MRHSLVAACLLTLISCKTNQQSETKEAFDIKDNANDLFTVRQQKAQIRELLGNASFQFSQLPREKQSVAKLWPTYYWPLAKGGITAKFNNESLSPMEKFERAFANELKKNPSYTDGMLTKFARDAAFQNTPDWWFGICHGSAEASAIFPEPVQKVTVNGVTLYPEEIKGLLSYFMSIDQSSVYFVGDRMNNEVFLDSVGRPLIPAARDVNPGLFHIIMTNVLGNPSRYNSIMDIRTGPIVLNFPVLSFKVLNVLSNDQLRSKYPQLYANNGNLFKYNMSAVTGVGIRAEVVFSNNHYGDIPIPTSVIEEHLSDLKHSEGYKKVHKTYEYMLELDQSGEIVGGEWLGESLVDHPDFIYVPKRGRQELASSGYTNAFVQPWSMLNQLVNQSSGVTNTLPPSVVPPTTNPNPVEPPATTDPVDSTSYMNVDIAGTYKASNCNATECYRTTKVALQYKNSSGVACQQSDGNFLYLFVGVPFKIVGKNNNGLWKVQPKDVWDFLKTSNCGSEWWLDLRNL